MRWILVPLTAIILVALLTLAVADGAKQPPVVADVELGAVNIENGISMSDSGDGQNEPAVIGGSACRVNKIDSVPPSLFMYFDCDLPVHRPAYVTVEYYDEGFGAFMIQYDAADLKAPGHGVYKNGAAELLLDSREWRSVTFELPDARFDGREEHGADFRLVCRSALAVKRVTVEMGASESFKRQPEANRERVARSVGRLAPVPGMQVTFAGVDDPLNPDREQVVSDLKLLAPMLKALGVTSVETSVPWKLVEAERERWDWSYCDEVAKVLAENKLRWTPMIVIGPGYASPKWFLDSADSLPAICLEHRKPAGTQSVWNPRMGEYVGRVLAQFRQHYGPGGVVESVMLGVNGDQGEAVYPVTAPTSSQAEYHSHPGFWCGDDYARDDFRRFLQTKYQTIAELNSAWKTSFDGFMAIVPTVPDQDQSARRRLDMIAWYRDSMTRWASTCLSIARKEIPSARIFLATGGDGRPAQGVDFAAQCKAAAAWDSGVQLGNEGSDYAFDFSVTRLAQTAAGLYKAPIALQQAGEISTSGLGGRIFNAVTSRARGVLSYYPTVLIQPGGIDRWSRNYRWLGSARDVRGSSVAVLFPQTSLALSWGGFYEKVMRLRDAVDFDLVDESMIRDRALERYKVLVLIEGKVMEREDIDRISAWMESGGIVVACDFGGFATVEGDSEPFKSMFDTSAESSLTRKVHGSGAAYYVAESWGGATSPAEGIAKVLGSLSTRYGTNFVPDGRIDGVYVTQAGGRLLVLNAGQESVTRELQVGIGRRKQVTVPAGAIIEVKE